jgi:hypothetical protein
MGWQYQYCARLKLQSRLSRRRSVVVSPAAAAAIGSHMLRPLSDASSRGLIIPFHSRQKLAVPAADAPWAFDSVTVTEVMSLVTP